MHYTLVVVDLINVGFTEVVPSFYNYNYTLVVVDLV